jgi:hypothetical protein
MDGAAPAPIFHQPYQFPKPRRFEKPDRPRPPGKDPIEWILENRD